MTTTEIITRKATEMNAETPTKESVLAAILAGDRTAQQVADRHGLSGLQLPLVLQPVLGALVCADLLYMKVVDREWHHLPTRKARKAAKA